MIPESLQLAARSRAVELLYANFTRTIWLTAVAMLVLAYVANRGGGGNAVAGWLAAALAVQGVRLVHVGWRRRSAEFLRDPRRDELELGAFCVLGALALGSPAIGFAANLLEPERSGLLILLLGVAGASASVMAASRIVFLAFLAPLAAMIALGAIAIEMPYFVAICVIFAGSLIFVHGRLHAALLDGFAARHEAIATRRELEAQLIELELSNAELLADRDAFAMEALTDALTGLANRRHFDKTLQRDWERARREDVWLSCIMMDVDHFKPYNDRYGHTAGDTSLRQVAATIVSSLNRGADFAARYGGEEFVLLLPDTDIRGAAMLAERIRAGVERIGFPHGAALTVSAGVASVRPEWGSDCAESLLAMADEALYRAKAAGRNRVCRADPGDVGTGSLRVESAR